MSYGGKPLLARHISVTGSDVVLTADQARVRSLIFHGALGANHFVTVDDGVTALDDGDIYVLRNDCTNAWTLFFRYSLTDPGVWVPPTGQAVTVMWNGGNWVYVDAGGGFVLQTTLTISGSASDAFYHDVWQIPLGWSIAGAAGDAIQMGAGGGVVKTSLGTTHGGEELLALHTFNAPPLVTNTGSAFASGAEVRANGTIISTGKQNSGTTSVPYIESVTARIVAL